MVRFSLPQNKNDAKLTLTISQNLLQKDRGGKYSGPVLTVCAVRSQLQDLQQNKASPLSVIESPISSPYCEIYIAMYYSTTDVNYLHSA